MVDELQASKESYSRNIGESSQPPLGNKSLEGKYLSVDVPRKRNLEHNLNSSILSQGKQTTVMTHQAAELLTPLTVTQRRSPNNLQLEQLSLHGKDNFSPRVGGKGGPNNRFRTSSVATPSNAAAPLLGQLRNPLEEVGRDQTSLRQFLASSPRQIRQLKIQDLRKDFNQLQQQQPLVLQTGLQQPRHHSIAIATRRGSSTARQTPLMRQGSLKPMRPIKSTVKRLERKKKTLYYNQGASSSNNQAASNHHRASSTIDMSLDSGAMKPMMDDIEARSFFILNDREVQQSMKKRQNGHEQLLINNKKHQDRASDSAYGGTKSVFVKMGAAAANSGADDFVFFDQLQYNNILNIEIPQTGNTQFAETQGFMTHTIPIAQLEQHNQSSKEVAYLPSRPFVRVHERPSIQTINQDCQESQRTSTAQQEQSQKQQSNLMVSRCADEDPQEVLIDVQESPRMTNKSTMHGDTMSALSSLRASRTQRKSQVEELPSKVAFDQALLQQQTLTNQTSVESHQYGENLGQPSQMQVNIGSLEEDLSVGAGVKTLQDLILQRQKRNEARAVSTIAAEHRPARLLVTERTDGGGGPYSRMTKFTRLDITKIRKRTGTTLGEQARQFASLDDDQSPILKSIIRQRQQDESSRGTSKMANLEIKARQLVPGKMYQLPPVVTRAPGSTTHAREMGTSMTRNDLSQIGLIGFGPVQTERKKFAYKEGHYIPGMHYVGTSNVDEDEQKAKSVVLKQLQPKMSKIMQQKLSPRLGKQSIKAEMSQENELQQRLVRQSCETESATPNGLREVDKLLLQGNAAKQSQQVFNINEQGLKDPLINLQINCDVEIQNNFDPTQLFVPLDADDQVCNTDDPFLPFDGVPPDTVLINKDGKAMKVITSGRPDTNSSHENEYADLNLDSMVSFDIHPIQANYNIVELPYDSSLDTTTDGGVFKATPTSKSPRARMRNKNGGTAAGKSPNRNSKLSSNQKFIQQQSYASSVERTANNSASYEQRRHMPKGNFNKKPMGAAQIVQRNGQPILVTSPIYCQQRQQKSPGKHLHLDFTTTSSSPKHVEPNPIIKTIDSRVSKSIARGSFETVNTMLVKDGYGASQSNSRQQSTRQSRKAAAGVTPVKQVIVFNRSNFQQANVLNTPQFPSQSNTTSSPTPNFAAGGASFSTATAVNIPSSFAQQESNKTASPQQAMRKQPRATSKQPHRGNDPVPIQIRILNVNSPVRSSIKQRAQQRAQASQAEPKEPMPAIQGGRPPQFGGFRKDEVDHGTVIGGAEDIMTAKSMVLKKRFEVNAFGGKPKPDDFGTTLRINSKKASVMTALQIGPQHSQAVESATLPSPVDRRHRVKEPMIKGHQASTGSQVEFSMADLNDTDDKSQASSNLTTASRPRKINVKSTQGQRPKKLNGTEIQQNVDIHLIL